MPLYRIGNKIVLFVHIPKTGGSTIEAWLNELGPRALISPRAYEGLLVTPQHFHANLLEKIVPQDFYDDSFCIVRDPIERLMSEYRWRKKPREKRFRLRRDREEGVDQSRDFARWVRKQIKQTRKHPLTADNHIRPQSDFLGLAKSRVYRFEDGFEAIMSDLAKQWNVPAPEYIPHENSTQKLPMHLDDKTRKLIDHFYAEDFKLLGYPRAADRDYSLHRLSSV